MKPFLRSSLMIVALLGGAHLGGSATFAQDVETRDGQPNFLHPRNGSSVSEQDVVSVLYTDGCGANELNPDVTPVVRREGGRIVVELTIRLSSTLPFCFAAQPPKEWVIPLGRLPKGNYPIERRVLQPAAPGAERPVLSLLLNSVRVGDTPHPSVSGTWFDPGAPGSGFVLTLIPDPNTVEPQAMVFSAARDQAQRPFWQVGIARFDNAGLTVAGTLGGSAGDSQQTQQLRFDYRGCGRLNVIDIRFPTFFTELKQLSTVDGVERCLPTGEVLMPAQPLDISLRP